ncbi:unnamed protein product, partial [Brachionus calyciflorus]
MHEFKNMIEYLDRKVSLNSNLLSLILNPEVSQTKNKVSENYEHYNLIDLNNNFKLSIIKLISDELMLREQRKKNIVIIGLPNTGNDNKLINRIFRTLNQPFPISFNRLKSNARNPVIICQLKSDYHVRSILKSAYNLRSTIEFKNVYINPDLSRNEKLINLLTRKDKKFYLSSKTSSSNNKSSILNSNNAGPSQPLNILEFNSIPELTHISLTTQNNSKQIICSSSKNELKKDYYVLNHQNLNFNIKVYSSQDLPDDDCGI